MSSRKKSVKHTHLYREIFEQPAVIARFLAAEGQNVAQLAIEIRRRQISHVVIAARGTSDNAGRYAKYVLGANNALTVGLAAPSLFTIFERPPRFGNALVLGISQSGKSPDIVAVLAEAQRQGALTAVITNNPNSDLAAQGDFVIDLHAGKELAVAATKTYTSELAAIALLSAALSKDAQQQDELNGVPQAVEQTLRMESAIAKIAPRYRYMQRCVVIGRGFNYATAFEIALKMKELTYTVAEPYSSADFLHGPLALIDEGFPALVVAPSGVMLPEMRAFMQKLKSYGAEVIGLSDNAAALKEAWVSLKLPAAVPEWLSPLTAIVPGQLLSLHLAHTRGFDVDSPRGIQKVTETH